MARPTKYTEERIQKIERALAVGATRTLACQHAGITLETFSQWCKTKAGFSERIENAEGSAAVSWLTVIEQATADHWQAAAWKLERRYPQDYGLRQRIDVRVELRREAERLAEQTGLDADELVKVAEDIMREARS